MRAFEETELCETHLLDFTLFKRRNFARNEIVVRIGGNGGSTVDFGVSPIDSETSVVTEAKAKLSAHGVENLEICVVAAEAP